MRSLHGLVAIAVGLAMALSAVACGDDDSSSGGGKLSNGGSGGTGGTVDPPDCAITDLGAPTCVTCVGVAVASCGNVALQCFGGGELLTCVRDAGCAALGQQPPLDMGCILSNCGDEMLDANTCMNACPQYVACFK